MIPLIHPSTIMIAGPTGSGKTVLVSNLIRHRMIYPAPQRIIIIYNEWQHLYDSLKTFEKHIEFIKGEGEEGYQRVYASLDPAVRNLVVLDDQMNDAGDSKTLAKFYTQGSHHRNLTVIYLVQNIYHKGSSQRDVSLNSQYLFVYKNARDLSQIDVLSRQMYPELRHFLRDVFKDATSEPFEYLLIDLRPETPDSLRLRAKVFPFDSGEVIYLQNDNLKEIIKKEKIK